MTSTTFLYISKKTKFLIILFAQETVYIQNTFYTQSNIFSKFVLSSEKRKHFQELSVRLLKNTAFCVKFPVLVLLLVPTREQ